MISMTCPQCGAELAIDVLTREPRPCGACGVVFSLESSERPQPEAEHQHAINGQKYFEIAAVIVMILVGFGYLAISNGQESVATPISQGDYPSLLSEHGFRAVDSTTLQGLSFETFQRDQGLLRSTVDLISFEAAGQQTLGAIVVAVALPKERPFPSDALIEPAVQEAFNGASLLAEALVPHSTPGLEKAVKTTAPITQGSLNHHKGVAQTHSGWKITYINYREYAGNGEDVPLLLFIYETLDFASDVEVKNFHEALYTSARLGDDLKRTLQDPKL